MVKVKNNISFGQNTKDGAKGLHSKEDRRVEGSRDKSQRQADQKEKNHSYNTKKSTTTRPPPTIRKRRNGEMMKLVAEGEKKWGD